MENIGVQEQKPLKKEEKVGKKSITAQARLMIIGFVVSTAFILGAASFATYSIDNNMNKAYKSFGQVLAKTLA